MRTTYLIGIVFVILKIAGAISWSWWWVTAPFWGMFALNIISVLIIIASVYLEDKKQ